ncbi:MAG: regulatory protein RecX [Candidatus Auribacterota bacterium]|nr:regulatory protein RecX [Candidatus Auribacterota bacterium]
MKKTKEYRKAWESALRLLNYRERSIKELSDRLSEKHYSPGTITAVIKRLKELDLLDDKKFARLWTRSRVHSKPRSAWLISRELREKGISEEVIQEVVEDEYTPEQEEEAAMSLAKKQAMRYRTDEPEKAREKLFAFLSRRGFSSDLIWKCLEEVLTS